MRDFFFMVRQKSRFGSFIQHANLMNLVGCNSENLKMIMKFLNYESVLMGNNQLIFVEKRNNNKIKNINLKENNKKLKTKTKNEKSENKSFGSLGAYFNK